MNGARALLTTFCQRVKTLNTPTRARGTGKTECVEIQVTGENERMTSKNERIEKECRRKRISRSHENSRPKRLIQRQVLEIGDERTALPRNVAESYRFAKLHVVNDVATTRL